MSHKAYLETIDESITMTPEVFVALMNKFKHHRGIRYCFSTKHTNDIVAYRGKTGAKMPEKVYDLPVEYNTEVTGVY